VIFGDRVYSGTLKAIVALKQQANYRFLLPDRGKWRDTAMKKEK
jgi:hypothetical protein